MSPWKQEKCEDKCRCFADREMCDPYGGLIMSSEEFAAEHKFNRAKMLATRKELTERFLLYAGK